MSRVTLFFEDRLRKLLPRHVGSRNRVEHVLERRTSVKDLIESLGVPHPEIASISVNGSPVDFHYIVGESDQIRVTPISAETDFFSPSLLRRHPLVKLHFVVDVNVGKLAGRLRLLGFDTLFHPGYDDARLAALAGSQRRILLSKDCNLLKRGVVEFGHLIRTDDPDKQIREVVQLFRLREWVRPYSRCLSCNGRLRPVSKEEILPRLLPLTRKYYDSFRICENCQKIYWPGSHRSKMDREVHAILADCPD